MIQREVFPNAPITEALLDIRAKLPPKTTLDILATLQDTIKDRYPKKRERQVWEGGFEVKPQGAPEVFGPKGGPDGYVFESVDRKHAVQSRLNGFTFNRLKPYDRWETLRHEAKELWQLYTQTAKPEIITRLALRYINRIEIPLPLGDFKEYILTVPEVAKDLPQSLANFFMRLMIPDQATESLAIVTLTVEPVVGDTNRLPLIFDIDVFKEASLEPQSPDIWKTLENLHDLKNNIFFGSLTERCKELFRT